MKFAFKRVPKPDEFAAADWADWRWQVRSALKSEADYAKVFELTDFERRGFTGQGFQVRTTRYYAALASKTDPRDSIRKILMPSQAENETGVQEQFDPLGERKNNPAPRIIHRYPDRALFLVTDFCSVYCRYCTRKHFTGGEQAFASHHEYQEALNYLRAQTGIREVILSGGDPLTLSDDMLMRVLRDIRAIEHIEIIRIGTRMPVVNPMRITESLVRSLREVKPVFLMTHFNHPDELTYEAANALELLVDNGVPVFNQMVLLNGVNNSAALVQALSRRLLYLRVKPYYMFQCDPSMGTDHLRTSVEESMQIQKELWGNLSGLAMPMLSLDIPNGGGKATLVPEFELLENRSGTIESGIVRSYKGWDHVRAEYKSPPLAVRIEPINAGHYQSEWEQLMRAKDVANFENVKDTKNLNKINSIAAPPVVATLQLVTPPAE